jgi:hypothetical protein
MIMGGARRTPPYASDQAQRQIKPSVRSLPGAAADRVCYAA